MKQWLKRNRDTLIAGTFLIPILLVAFVSISHVTEWYGITNPMTWAIYLSFGIEIAALSALAGITVGMRKFIYIPFGIVTFLQLIGNIFYAYQFIQIDGRMFAAWVELVSPLFELMGVEPGDLPAHKRILSMLSGGLLPLISLTFLHMLVKFKDHTDRKAEADVVPTPITAEQAMELANQPEPTPVVIPDETLDQIQSWFDKLQPTPTPSATATPLPTPEPTPTPSPSEPLKITEEEKVQVLEEIGEPIPEPTPDPIQAWEAEFLKGLNGVDRDIVLDTHTPEPTPTPEEPQGFIRVGERLKQYNNQYDNPNRRI